MPKVYVYVAVREGNGSQFFDTNLIGPSESDVRNRVTEWNALFPDSATENPVVEIRQVKLVDENAGKRNKNKNTLVDVSTKLRELVQSESWRRRAYIVLRTKAQRKVLESLVELDPSVTTLGKFSEQTGVTFRTARSFIDRLYPILCELRK